MLLFVISKDWIERAPESPLLSFLLRAVPPLLVLDSPLLRFLYAVSESGKFVNGLRLHGRGRTLRGLTGGLHIGDKQNKDEEALLPDSLLCC